VISNYSWVMKSYLETKRFLLLNTAVCTFVKRHVIEARFDSDTLILSTGWYKRIITIYDSWEWSCKNLFWLCCMMMIMNVPLWML